MRDRPPEQWPRDEHGRIAYVDRELDLDGLLTELPGRTT
jgi:catechol-2,3-dioxygenase